MPFGENLRHAMARRGITPPELSTKAKVSAPTLHRYMNGERDTRPSAPHVNRIATALGMTPAELLGPSMVESRDPPRLDALARAAEQFRWDVPTTVISVVMARARAEAATNDQPEWFWGLRLKELVAEVTSEPPLPPPRKPKS